MVEHEHDPNECDYLSEPGDERELRSQIKNLIIILQKLVRVAVVTGAASVDAASSAKIYPLHAGHSMWEDDFKYHGDHDKSTELNVPDGSHFLVITRQKSVGVVDKAETFVVRYNDEKKAQIQKLNDTDSVNTVFDRLVLVIRPYTLITTIDENHLKDDVEGTDC